VNSCAPRHDAGMVTPKRVVATLAALVSLGACGKPATYRPSEECNDFAHRAYEIVERALDANSSCRTADDCTFVGMQSRCFDACHRSMNKAHVPALVEAIAVADRTVCPEFEAEGCGVITPPCAPPLEPQCIQGACYRATRAVRWSNAVARIDALGDLGSAAEAGKTNNVRATHDSC
jgi:hypothetical protein